MDNICLSGFDYDAYRKRFRNADAGRMAGESDTIVFSSEQNHFDGDTGRKRGRRMRRFAATIAVSVAVLVAWYSLRFIPLFDISRIAFTVSGGFTSVPTQVAGMANSTMGKSLVSGAPRELKKSLETIPVVADAKVRRRFSSTLDVSLVIEEPSAFIAAVNESDEVASIYMVKGNALRMITETDFSKYGNRVFVVEVSPSYAAHLETYGLDEGIVEVMRLAGMMGMDPDGRYSLIGRIRYEDAPGGHFGRMVLHLPAYNTELWIREPVGESRLHDAVRLIRLEHERDLTRNIALRRQLRYDLYAHSLVSRQ